MFLMNLVSELYYCKRMDWCLLVLLEDGGAPVNQTFNEQIEYLERVTTNLHESVDESSYDAN